MLARNGCGPSCYIQQNGPRRVFDQLARTINSSDTPTTGKNQGSQLLAGQASLAESDSAYPHDWRGRSYCRTRDALIRCCGAYSGEIDPAAAAALQALPERIEHDGATS